MYCSQLPHIITNKEYSCIFIYKANQYLRIDYIAFIRYTTMFTMRCRPHNHNCTLTSANLEKEKCSCMFMEKAQSLHYRIQYKGLKLVGHYVNIDFINILIATMEMYRKCGQPKSTLIGRWSKLV